MSSSKYIVYTDGGARWNPGPAGCGMYICDEKGNTIEKSYAYLGFTTNNVAEYRWAFFGIAHAIEKWATEIELRADSKLVIEQLSWNYKIKNEGLKVIAREIFALLDNWDGKIAFTHVYREQNTVADALSNKAMDEKKENIIYII